MKLKQIGCRQWAPEAGSFEHDSLVAPLDGPERSGLLREPWLRAEEQDVGLVAADVDSGADDAHVDEERPFTLHPELGQLEGQVDAGGARSHRTSLERRGTDE